MTNIKDFETSKKNVEKNKNTSKSKNNSKTKNTKKTTNKTNSTKKTTTTKKTNAKSSTKKTIPKKTTTTKTQGKTPTKRVVREKKLEIKSVDIVNVLENDKKEVIEEVNNVAKLEDAKTIKKKDKKLLFIGVFIALLGIVALFISLVANRTIDREFLSDNIIVLMMTISIIIEIFGAFIIINES